MDVDMDMDADVDTGIIYNLLRKTLNQSEHMNRHILSPPSKTDVHFSKHLPRKAHIQLG